jgi:serine/threonine-protein kinase
MSKTPDSVLDIKPGDVLAGKYRVERILGSGGMGMVVAAHHLQLDERVALKFLLPSAISSMEVVARFMREARAAFKVKSEHVARVTDVAQLENGSPYIVMEYLEGGDLAEWLVQRGGMPVEQAVDFVLQACEALAEAHARGIVHRDLKPANLFCVQRADGQLSIKILDFGISKITSEAGSQHQMTKTNGIVGSPLYMSPEHMKSSRNVDARTDIWSLGVILFELIAGRPPFEAETVPELVLKVAAEPPFSLRRFVPGAPADLEAVVARALAKDRDKRYQNVAELAQALLPFGPAHGQTSVARIQGTMDRAAAAAAAGARFDQSTSEIIILRKQPEPAPAPEPDDGPPTRPPPAPPQPGVPLVAGLPEPANPTMPMTASSWGRAAPDKTVSSPFKMPTERVVIAAGIATAALVSALVVAVAWSSLRTPARPPAADFAPDTPTHAAAPPVTTSIPLPTPQRSPPAPQLAPPPPPPPPAPAAGSSEPAPSASEAPPPPPVLESPTPPATAAGVASTHASPPPTPARNPCSPPYYFDAKGTRHFKSFCL